MRGHRLAAGWIGVIAVAGVLHGCITPTIPIPPPDPTLMTFELGVQEGQSVAVFSYAPNDNYVGAIVFVYNRDLGVGVIQNANSDGSVGPTSPVLASLGQQMVVTVEREDQTVSTCVRLRAGAQSPTDYCGP